MAELTIRIREEHKSILADLAEQQWRDDAQQASAIVEQVLIAHRAKSDPNTTPRRRARSRNGTHTLVAGGTS